MDELNRKEDEAIRRKMDELPEESPDPSDWSRLSEQLASEGVFKEDGTRWKLFFIFSALIALLGISWWLFSSHPDPSLARQQTPTQSQPVLKDMPSTTDSKTTSSANPAQGNNENKMSEKEINKQPSTATNKNVSSVPGKKNTQPESTPSLKRAAASETEKTTQPTRVLSHETIKTNPEPVVQAAQEKEKEDTRSVAREETGNIKDPATEVIPTPVLTIASDGPGIKGEDTPRDQVNSELPLNPSLPIGKKDSSLTQLKDSSVQSKDELPKSAEDQKNSALKKSKWSVGPYFSLDNNSFQLKSKTNTGNELIKEGAATANNSKDFQYTAGIRVNYSVTDNLVVGSGISLSQKQKVLSKFYFAGYTSGSSTFSYNNYTFSFSGRYLELPLLVKWMLIPSSKILRPYVALGNTFVFNLPKSQEDYFINVKETETGTQTDKVILQSRPRGMTGYVAAGCDVLLYRKWRFYLEPAYRYSFSPVINQSVYKEIPFEHFIRTFSIGGGISYEL